MSVNMIAASRRVSACSIAAGPFSGGVYRNGARRLSRRTVRADTHSATQESQKEAFRLYEKSRKNRHLPCIPILFSPPNFLSSLDLCRDGIHRKVRCILTERIQLL